MWRQIWRDLLIERPNLEQPAKVRTKQQVEERQADVLAIVAVIAVGVILIALGWQLLS